MANTSYVGVGPADRDPTVSDNSVTTAKIQDNAVTGPKIAMTSDAAGDILTYTGTDYARLGIGTASQVLKVNGAANAVEWATDAAGTGDVVGPGSSTNDALARFDTTTGKLIQNSTATLSDAGTLTATAFSGPLTGNVTGNASGTAATVTCATQASITSIANLATVGTIATGTWEATDIGIAHGGTGASTDSAARTALGVAIGSDVQAYSASNAVTNAAQEFTAQQNFNNTTLTFDATQDWALTANQVTTLTLTANTVFDAPTQMVDGAFYSILIQQDGTGGWTCSFPAATFKWAAGTAPTLTTTASAKDLLVFRSNGTLMYEVGRQLNLS